MRHRHSLRRCRRGNRGGPPWTTTRGENARERERRVIRVRNVRSAYLKPAAFVEVHENVRNRPVKVFDVGILPTQDSMGNEAHLFDSIGVLCAGEYVLRNG